MSEMVGDLKGRAEEFDWFDAGLVALGAEDCRHNLAEEWEAAAGDDRFDSFEQALPNIRALWKALTDHEFDGGSPLEDVLNAIYFAGWKAGASFVLTTAVPRTEAGEPEDPPAAQS